MAVCESETCAETIVLSSTKELSVTHQIKNEGSEPVVPYQRKWVWLNLIGIIITHFFGLSAFLLVLRVKLSTVIWNFIIGTLGGFGVTGGAHRLWTHRAYKAKTPLRWFLIFCFTLSGQNTLFDWVRDHRVHHKFSETDADPHNAKRGFWFAHCGWLVLKKHPEVLRKGKLIDMSDIRSDSVVKFHQKYFMWLKIMICFILPVFIPYYWGESLWYSFLAMNARYIVQLNSTWLVNSAAHIWGNKPFDKNISPAENKLVSFMAIGEGWHNYHHVFPWDYKAAELGNYTLNLTTMLIDMFAKIGWAYDLKKASKTLIKSVSERYGDGSHEPWEEFSECKEEANHED